MAERITVTSQFAAPPEVIWEHVQTPALLQHIASPLLHFEPLDGAFPARWASGDHPARLKSFGIFPAGQQIIGIEYPECDSAKYVLRDNGRGTMASRWDHWIFIDPEGAGSRYTDRLDIEAGALTPFVAAFARLLHRHRQRRWRALIADDFRALA